MSQTRRIEETARLDGIRVLVVDDSPDVLAHVTEILERRGATVAAVGSAHEALQIVEREHPNVVLSDLAMPDKGGYWLIGKIRALPPEHGGRVPAAALTPYTGPEHRASVLRAGFQHHVAKPVDPHHLVGVVSMLALKE
jgi:CheY-like chemotaxis protein